VKEGVKGKIPDDVLTPKQTLNKGVAAKATLPSLFYGELEGGSQVVVGGTVGFAMPGRCMYNQ
jgi:hypothetical protein